MDMSTHVVGAQVVRRVALVLRAVSASMPQGLGTSEVARAAQLSRSTAHRLLASLAADGFIDHDRVTGRWHLGPELYLMGAAAAARYDVTRAARDTVRALAAATGESAFFSARRGDETVCLVREEGAFPIRSFVLYEGVRFPLGVASAGLAILSFLPDATVDAYLASTDLSAYGASHGSTALRERIRTTRAAGWALNPGLIVPSSWGMAAAVFDSAGQPAWALSLTGIDSRFSPARQPELGRLLLHQAHRVSQRLASGG